MERILYTSDTFHRDKLYIYVLTAEDDADASHGRRSSTKATTRNEQDHDVSHAVGIGLLAIMYSAAFAIYYFVSNLMTTTTSIIFNVIMRSADKKKQNEQGPIIIQQPAEKKRKNK